jgi:hypothetical protein
MRIATEQRWCMPVVVRALQLIANHARVSLSLFFVVAGLANRNL